DASGVEERFMGREGEHRTSNIECRSEDGACGRFTVAAASWSAAALCRFGGGLHCGEMARAGEVRMKALSRRKVPPATDSGGRPPHSMTLPRKWRSDGPSSLQISMLDVRRSM